MFVALFALKLNAPKRQIAKRVDTEIKNKDMFSMLKHLSSCIYYIIILSW